MRTFYIFECYGVTYLNVTEVNGMFMRTFYGTTENLYICAPICIEKLRMLYMSETYS
jgi:hypothetical protein